MKNLSFLFFAITLINFACQNTEKGNDKDSQTAIEDTIIYPSEKHFKSLKQLTFGGDNAEAYWSFDDTKLIFQVTNPAWENELF
jgi:hypothetical protein